MTDMHERLRQAREAAGFEKASDAARALDVPVPTYLGHENGSRTFRPSAEQYARRFGVSLEWLLTGRGHRERRPIVASSEKPTVPIVGYVSAGLAHFFADQGEIDRVMAPEGSTTDTVAVELRGESLGEFFDGWLAYYDDVRRPVTPDLIGQLCIVGLDDGRILIKKLHRSKTRGLFHLRSLTEPPIFDVAVEWAARVKSLAPR
jgi:hypothetical protein